MAKKKEVVLVCAGCQQPREDAETLCPNCGVVDIAPEGTPILKLVEEKDAEG
jgi:RNA polymerase subunit RPABC4/transcription elongation factor Spt4